MRTGDYKISYFNRYGKRLKNIESSAESVINAHESDES
jgi:hypothetical protein